MLRPLVVLGLLVTLPGLLLQSATADTLRVPEQYASIQMAINAAKAGDTVLVAAGTYRERIRLKPDVTVQSAGDDSRGELGLKRAEATIVDAGGDTGDAPGVSMAAGSTLDGFTVTRSGLYDDAEWNKHHATHGEEQSHERIGHFGTPGIGISGVNCTVKNNIVHHNGFTGIAIRGVQARRCSPWVVGNICYRNMGGGIGSVEGSTATIERNVCFENFYAGIGHDNAHPFVTDNECYANIRAGIGISEGAKPTVRGNRCYRNRRAGIGIRTGAETCPLIEGNDCYENEMAGIGNRDQAAPIIRGNRCYRNKMAGIGSRDGARALIEGNACYENEMSGIGSRLDAAPVIRGNRCYKNMMAGIGVREHARPVIEDNDCFENKMAGIGCREGAAPILRGNRCYRNQLAGIGARDGARPIVVENECRENVTVGIGVRAGAAAVIIGNRCLENRLVALGLPDRATAYVHGNEFVRTGGGPPLIAVKGSSTALLSANRIQGGGVAGLLVQGTALVMGNQFQGRGAGQGSAIWVWDQSTAHVWGNRLDGYRTGLQAGGSKITALDNLVTGFQGSAINVRKPAATPRVFGNVAVSGNKQDQVVSLDETVAATAGNQLRSPDKPGLSPAREWDLWTVGNHVEGQRKWHGASQVRPATVTQGPWKLIILPGEPATYQLFHVPSDPMEQRDRSEDLEQIVFRLRGLAERQAVGSEEPPAPGKPQRD